MAGNTTDINDLQRCDLSNFKFLGAGMIGKVFSAETKSGDIVAVKKILIEQVASIDSENTQQTETPAKRDRKTPSKERSKNAQQREIEKEIKVLRSLMHDNIVTCLAVINNPDERELWIVMEFMENGTLKRFVGPAASATRLDENQIYNISLQCWSALAYLHAQHITHRDIKPENILVRDLGDKKYLIKFCDFQFSVIKDRTSLVAKTTTVAGLTYAYAPPETAGGVYHATEGDIYSLGVTLCELHTFQPFWGDINDQQLPYKLAVINDYVKKNRYTFKNPAAKLKEHLPAGYKAITNCSCSVYLKTMLLQATSFNPSERPTAVQALDMNCINFKCPLVLTENETVGPERAIAPRNVHVLYHGWARKFKWHPNICMLAWAGTIFYGEYYSYTFLEDFRRTKSVEMNFKKPVGISLKDTAIGWENEYYSKFMAWNPQGTFLATGSCDGYVRMWTPEGSLVNTFEVSARKRHLLRKMQWNPEGTHILCILRDELCLWKAATGERQIVFDCPTTETGFKSCDWKNSQSFACLSDKNVYLYSVDQTWPVKRFEHKNDIQKVKWDPSRTVLASLSSRELIIWCAAQSMDTCVKLDYNSQKNTCMAWNNDTAVPILASGSDSGDAHLWELERGTCMNTFSRLHEHVNYLSFSPTNTLLAVAYNYSCSVWDTRMGEKPLKSICQPRYEGMKKIGWNCQGNALSAITATYDLILLDLRYISD